MLWLMLALAAADPTSTTTAPSDAADVIVNLSNGVAAQRAAIDSLADEVARERAAARDELAALERRRRELQARLDDALLLRRELQTRLDAHDDVVRADDEAAIASRAPVIAAAARLLGHIDAVPFRVGSRRDRCRAVVDAAPGRAPLATAAALWPLIVDEATLLSQTSRARQPVTLDGKPVLAEVAHVGALVFFRTPDGRVGQLRDGTAVVVDEVESRQRLVLFFEALKRDQGRGLFWLPAVLPPAAPSQMKQVQP